VAGTEVGESIVATHRFHLAGQALAAKIARGREVHLEGLFQGRSMLVTRVIRNCGASHL